ncbi:hypothetical protein LOAG_01610 [Loa loa]|uniref:Uncharacterized protein n=1 Tax=Loa loa TaxID=7209 RepID=A0A1S0U8Y8_LOALO|nr:hypothetical protein LOAG_01610 [Loa loa]EFO26875.1 hypothetical protein LOAG_01610 [Loa loa]
MAIVFFFWDVGAKCMVLISKMGEDISAILLRCKNFKVIIEGEQQLFCKQASLKRKKKKKEMKENRKKGKDRKFVRIEIAEFTNVRLTLTSLLSAPPLLPPPRYPKLSFHYCAKSRQAGGGGGGG